MPSHAMASSPPPDVSGEQTNDDGVPSDDDWADRDLAEHQDTYGIDSVDDVSFVRESSADASKALVSAKPWSAAPSRNNIFGAAVVGAVVLMFMFGIIWRRKSGGKKEYRLNERPCSFPVASNQCKSLHPVTVKSLKISELNSPDETAKSILTRTFAIDQLPRLIQSDDADEEGSFDDGSENTPLLAVVTPPRPSGHHVAPRVSDLVNTLDTVNPEGTEY